MILEGANIIRKDEWIYVWIIWNKRGEWNDRSTKTETEITTENKWIKGMNSMNRKTNWRSKKTKKKNNWWIERISNIRKKDWLEWCNREETFIHSCVYSFNQTINISINQSICSSIHKDKNGEYYVWR